MFFFFFMSDFRFVHFECHCLFQFLIEVRNANLRMVPSDWIKISA